MEDMKMKITFPKEMKRVITVAEMPMVREIMRNYNTPEEDLIEYAEMAARVVARNNDVRILEAKASIAKNCRIQDQYTDESGNLDIWIDFTAFAKGIQSSFMICGVYLSDIWKIGPAEMNEYVKSHMFIRKFEETK